MGVSSSATMREGLLRASTARTFRFLDGIGRIPDIGMEQIRKASGRWRARVDAPRNTRTFGTMLAEMEVERHVERFLNHSMGTIDNQAESIVSAVADVHLGYMPKVQGAIETSGSGAFKR
jgi:hypothetical protein